MEKIAGRIVLRIVRNRWGYTDEELAEARKLGLLDAIGIRDLFFWLKAEPVSCRHCMGQNYEGRPLYFDAMGGLIKRKCPPSICIHGLSQLSPLIYSYYDHMLRGENPDRMIFHTVACTDPGLEWGGLGSCIFRLSRERMPLREFALHNLHLLPYLFRWDRRQRGKALGLAEAGGEARPWPGKYPGDLPLSEEDLGVFLSVPERRKRLQALERFRDYRIVLRVVDARGCIAGHRVGDEIALDPYGRVLPGAGVGGPCIMALNKAWFRVMLVLERMAQAEEGQPDLDGSLLRLPISCYGGAWPLGACGRILMTVEVRRGEAA